VSYDIILQHDWATLYSGGTRFVYSSHKTISHFSLWRAGSQDLWQAGAVLILQSQTSNNKGIRVHFSIWWLLE